MERKKKKIYQSPMVVKETVIEVEFFIASSANVINDNNKEEWKDDIIGGDGGDFSGEFTWE